jgi:hypothetical protein
MAALPVRAQPTVDAIYAAYEAAQERDYRNHLGASVIGDPCDRALWYGFRWATLMTFSGRMLRLFETGQLAEPRFVENLKSIGVEVHDTDESGRQFTVRDDTGHFGGSMDGCALGIPEAPKTWHVCEFKTHNAKSFATLVKHGVEQAKPRHYAQMQIYMHLSGMDRALYLAVNKDTDELHAERVRLDVEFAIRMVARARRIVCADRPPSKISNDPAWHECRFCDHRAVCHEGATPPPHCRSCLHATPIEGGAWACAIGQLLTPEAQRAGCPKHLYIPDFIPGEQIDAGQHGDGSGFVTYRLRDGTEWTDGVPF